MRIDREGKEAVAQLVQDLEAGLVLRGILRGRSGAWAVGPTDLEHVFLQCHGMEFIFMLLPLSGSMPVKICPTCGKASSGPVCRACTVVDEDY